jgi:hypothetical protein
VKLWRVVGSSILLLLSGSCSDDAGRAEGEPVELSIPRDYLAVYYSEATGVHAIDVDTFTADWSDVPDAGTSFPLQSAGMLEGGVIQQRRPYALYYLKGSHWYRRNLRVDADPAPMRLTEETQPSLCSFPTFPALLEYDLTDPENAAVTYSTSGLDDDCSAGMDNDTRSIPVSGGPAMHDMLPPFDPLTQFLHRFHDTQGALTGVLVSGFVDGSPDIALYDATFDSRTTVIPDVWSSSGWGIAGADYVVLGANESVYRVDAAGEAVVLHTLTPGSHGGMAMDDGTAVFFVERDDAPATSSRLWRFPMAGDGPAELMANSESGIRLVGTTDLRVVYTDDSGMMSLPKSATPAETPTVLEVAVPPKAWTVGNDVFYNVAETVDGFVEWRARLRRDTGELMLDLERSEWAGYSLRPERVLDSYLRRDIVFGLLAQGYDGHYAETGQKGATLRVYDFALATFRDIAMQEESGSVLAYGMRGPAGIGYFDNSNGQLTDTDVVGLDLERAVLVRLTRTAGNEFPRDLAE